jgi:hypothetical protein
MRGDDLRLAGDAEFRQRIGGQFSWSASRNRCPSKCRRAVCQMNFSLAGKIERRNRALGKKENSN